jgi:hypothetical protein
MWTFGPFARHPLLHCARMVFSRWSRLAALYAGTVFVSAFLLFQVQPLISRFILPWFGGTPAVWTTCLLFFQTTLFAGYAYAHLSEHYFRPRVRMAVHLILIGAALCTLPITPSDWWKPGDSANPTGRILALLAVCVGLPYFVLSSTGPLVQAWFSQTLPGKSPYRLYSLSNLGSLLALLSYPFVVEPMLDGYAQSWWWTAAFVLFCILSATACWQTARLRQTAGAVDAEIAPDDEPAPSWLRRLLWLLLPAFASILLLATNNHVCQDMPSVPFLWVVPLSLYLLSFIICFDHERWYWRLPYGLAALVAIYMTVGLRSQLVWASGWLGFVHGWLTDPSATDWTPGFGYKTRLFWEFSALFLLCMLCHGELVRLRPRPRYLTSFYLMISAGGALGGLSVSLVAPLIFHTYLEWKIGLVTGFVLAAVVAFVTGWRGWQRPQFNVRNGMRACGIVVALLFLNDMLVLLPKDDMMDQKIVEQSRGFYGVLTLAEVAQQPPIGPVRVLYNNGTLHGMQFTDANLQQISTTYYSENSGVGRTFAHYQLETARTGAPLLVGAVGLGVGTLAAYVYQPWHTIRFYEINPDVVRLAEKDFTFLADARERNSTVEIVMGDARLTLERELNEPRKFQMLVLDAFSGDSIPIHLLTTEAFDIYRQHMAPGGAIAVHISNRHLDLNRVTHGLAEHIGFEAVQVYTFERLRGAFVADWVILSQNQKLLEELRAIEGNQAGPAPEPPFPLWTDRRHNLLEILH